MSTLNNEPLSDQAFLERLKDQPYVLQHTGRKSSYKLYLDGKTRVVEGLIRVVRKQLRVEEKPHHFLLPVASGAGGPVGTVTF
jgi:hypothetical protein